jgi:histidine triad (HIT) family protein
MSSCLFCDIVAGKIPCTQVYADEEFLAFKDIDPKAPTHILIIPRQHIARLSDLEDQHQALMGAWLVKATRIAAAEGLAERGFRFVINCGAEGGQTVDHLHLHILGGRNLQWPPG